jgi:outer membrane lipoprotein carrier protein
MKKTTSRTVLQVSGPGTYARPRFLIESMQETVMMMRQWAARWALAAFTLGAVGLGTAVLDVEHPAAPVAHAQGTQSAEQIADKIQKFYTDIKDYQARFEQVFTDPAKGKETRSGGRVYFKKPGKMRWDYVVEEGGAKALQKVLVSNGSEFTIYEAAHNQYYRQCLNDSKLPTALRFLMGSGDLKSEFNIALIKSADAGTRTLEMTPKQSAGKYKKLVFVVDALTWSVRETIVYDPYGNTNRIIFHKPLVNKNLPDAGFDFKPPATAQPLGGAKDLKCP